MSERFFIDSPITADEVILHGPEAHHLAHVMRIKVGERVTLFDGSGFEFDATVQKVGKAAVELAVTERRSVDRESPQRLTLAVALPKGDRQQWLVEKTVELGVAAIVPIIVERSVAMPTASTLVRLRRMVIEASKQCGRNRLLEILEPQPWNELAGKTKLDALRLLAHPGGKPLREIWPAEDREMSGKEIVAAIGPEGGFTASEIEIGVAAGWTSVDLGPRILRVETAAIAIAAWCASAAK